MRRAKPKAKQQIEVRGPIPVRPQGQILVARRTMVIGHVLTSEALVRQPQCFDGWGVVTAADLKGLNPAANWSASRGYSDSSLTGWRRFDHPGW